MGRNTPEMCIQQLMGFLFKKIKWREVSFLIFLFLFHFSKQEQKQSSESCCERGEKVSVEKYGEKRGIFNHVYSLVVQ